MTQISAPVFGPLFPALDACHIHVIIHMRMVGRKMPWYNADFDAFVATGGDLLNSGFHADSSCRLRRVPHVVDTGSPTRPGR